MDPVSGRGFYGIGIVGSKTPLNVGTLWRSAFAMDAAFIFTAGRRYPRQASDTVKAYRHVPMFEFADTNALWDAIPHDCVPVAVELDERARSIDNYVHPERAIYILGAEDYGIQKAVLSRCRDIIQLPGCVCLNVATAGSIVMYDRYVKRGAVAQMVEHLSEKQGVAGSTPARPTLIGSAA